MDVRVGRMIIERRIVGGRTLCGEGLELKFGIKGRNTVRGMNG